MHERVANLLGAASLAVTDAIVRAAIAAGGVNATAGAALVVLADSDGIGVTELGRRVGVTQSAAARMVDLLAERGLVRRRGGSGRMVGVCLTPEGAAAAGRLLAARAGALEGALGELAPAELAKLAELLESILRAVRAGGAEPDRICRLCDRAVCIAAGAACPVGVGAGHG
ncbi:MarR family winged helix-turn-helix transcriptional regulator [Nocardia goodfellowii]